MPNKPLTICSYPGCATLVLDGRCDRHPYPRKQTDRPSPAARGYDASWYRERARHLKAHPVCEERRKCSGARATEVDHTTTMRDGGTNEWHNLKAMCKPCHSSKTARLDTPRRGGRFHAKP